MWRLTVWRLKSRWARAKPVGLVYHSLGLARHVPTPGALKELAIRRRLLRVISHQDLSIRPGEWGVNIIADHHESAVPGRADERVLVSNATTPDEGATSSPS